VSKVEARVDPTLADASDIYALIAVAFRSYTKPPIFLLARDKPACVVLRRGPSKQVCAFLWGRSRDQFSMGQ